jgi:hypothetical protein
MTDFYQTESHQPELPAPSLSKMHDPKAIDTCYSRQAGYIYPNDPKELPAMCFREAGVALVSLDRVCIALNLMSDAAIQKGHTNVVKKCAGYRQSILSAIKDIEITRDLIDPPKAKYSNGLKRKPKI